MIRVVVADDHAVVRAGVRALLDSEPDLRVVAEISGGTGVVEAVASTRSEVLVVDLSMDGLCGFEVVRRVRRDSPGARIVVFTMHASVAVAAKALRSGALGFVSKGSAGSELVRAVRAAAAWRRFVSPPLTVEDVDCAMRRGAASPADPLTTLTDREREALHLGAQGHSNAEVAARMGVKVRTAESHRASILRKLGLRNQAELAGFAFRHGIVLGPSSNPPPSP